MQPHVRNSNNDPFHSEAMNQFPSQLQGNASQMGGNASQTIASPQMMPNIFPMQCMGNQQQIPPAMWQQNANFSGGFSGADGRGEGTGIITPLPMPQMSSPNIISHLNGRQTHLGQIPIPISEPGSLASFSGNKKNAAPAKGQKPSKGGSKATSKGQEDGEEPNSSKAKNSARERNREHARSTRMRKKAYIQKLKDMAQGLRAVQAEEIRQKRTSMQKMLEIQKIRRTVVQTVLRYHSSNEQDVSKWKVLLENSFWLKEPVTPFRSFRRSEIDRDCRIVRGIDSMICDAASLAVMVERIGCHNARWRRINRRNCLGEGADFLNKEITVGMAPESSLSSDTSSDTSSNSNDFKKRKRSDPSGQVKNDVPEGNAQLLNNGHHTFGIDTAPQAIPTDVPSEQSGTKRQRIQCETVSNPTAQQTGQSVSGHSIVSGRELSASGLNAPALSRHDSKMEKSQRTKAYYCSNEDDMIMMEDVMMCPYVFRTSNAVLCGALADCVMPGMLRAQFSPNNKLLSMEMVFDAMGFMQQLDGSNGGDITAQVIPGSLEMALFHCPHEARVITEAKPPYSILHVNEAWTKLTNYSQVEAEGKHLLQLLQRQDSASISQPNGGHNLEQVANGRACCSTILHYEKSGKPFVDFVCSYPLTNATDEITHLLHVNMELPPSGNLIS